MLHMKYCVIPKQNEKHFNIDHFHLDIAGPLRKSEEKKRLKSGWGRGVLVDF